MNNNNIHENYVSRFAIGQVIKQNDKYWQITKFTNPSTGDWFIANFDINFNPIRCCPSYLYFDNDDRRYIVREVSVTPKPENKDKLPVGTIITVNDEFYEVIDYRIPQANEQYIYLGDGSTLIYTRRYDIEYTASYNIVVKIEPYKRGQVITVANQSYTVVDYACPKKDQLFLNKRYAAVYSASYDWLTEKTFILEPIEPIAPPDPEATVYKPGQLIVRENLVYRVIAYREARKNEYITDSTVSSVIMCNCAITSSKYWVVEPYCVPAEIR